MIKQIEIRYFRGIESLDINVQRFNMFAGPNGSGKTSIISAIRFALTGKAKKEDIKNGHTKAGVRVIFDDNSFFTRYLTQAGVVAECNGKKTTIKSLNEYIEMKLGMTIYAIGMMLGEEYYTDVNMSSLLMSLIPVQVEKASFIKIAESIKGDVLSKSEIYMINRYFGDIITSEDLNKVENTVKAEKTAYNRDIKKIDALLKNYNATVPKYSKEELEKMLADMSYDEIYKIKLQEYESSIKNYKNAQERKKEKTAELEKYKNLPAKDEKEVKQTEERITALEREISEIEKTVAATEANNALIIKTLDALNTSICPISNKLICNTDKTPLKKELEEQKGVNESLIAESSRKIEKNKASVKELKEALIRFQKLSEDWKRREALENEIREIEKNMPVIKEKPVMPENPQMPKEEVLKQLHVWETLKEKELREAELSNLKKRVFLLDYVLNLLKPENAKTKIMQRIIEPVEKLVNEKAAGIGKKIQIMVGKDGITIYLETKNGKVNITRCSSGEFVDIVYLIMTAISSINNANIIVLDNLDKLDDEALEKLVASLQRDEHFKYIFIAGIHAVQDVEGITILQNI